MRNNQRIRLSYDVKNPLRPIMNSLQDLHNSSYYTKAEFNNCVLLFIQNISQFLIG